MQAPIIPRIIGPCQGVVHKNNEKIKNIFLKILAEMRYNKPMKTQDLQKLTDKLWDDYSETFPRLVRFNPPIIKINNRFTKTAGCNRTEDNIIELAGKFLAQFPDNMLRVILPHEIAHQIDFDLNGWYDRKPHHGKEWIEIMVKIGQKPNPYHSMILKK